MVLIKATDEYHCFSNRIWAPRPVTSSEATTMLPQFLDCQDITSHSLKCTMLSWCSKYGLPKEVRAALGRHSSATHGSDALYSDLAVEPVRQLQLVIDSIASGSFHPDGKRSGYFKPVQQPVVTEPSPATMDEVNVETDWTSGGRADQSIQVDSDSSIESSSGLGDGSSDHEQLPKRLSVDDTLPDFDLRIFFKHNNSKIIHEAHADPLFGDDVMISMCGRAMSSKYQRLKEFNWVQWSWKCKICAKAWLSLNLWTRQNDCRCGRCTCNNGCSCFS